MMSSSDFQGKATRLGQKYSHGGIMTPAAIDAIFSSLGSAVSADTATTHDVTITTPAGTLSPSSWPDGLTRELELLINRGRNDLGAAAMGAILTNLAAAILFPPANTAAPVASATSLSVAGAGVASVTNGTWTQSPTSYTYQWLRNSAPIFNATAASYTLAAADVGSNLSCIVTATNPDGSGNATSNAIGPVTA